MKRRKWTQKEVSDWLKKHHALIYFNPSDKNLFVHKVIKKLIIICFCLGAAGLLVLIGNILIFRSVSGGMISRKIIAK